MMYCGGSLSLLSAGDPPLVEDEPEKKALKIDQIDPYPQYKWIIKRVLNSKDHKLKYIPRHFSNITLNGDGISGFDGVNRFWGRITYFSDGTVKIGALMTTDVGGETDPIQISNAKKIVWDKKTHILQLITPTEIYEFERFKPSRLSQNWSLAKIEDRKTKKVENVNRFRSRYRHLLLSITDDKSFRFTDMDMDEFSGTIKEVDYDLPTYSEKVSKIEIAGMKLNDADQKRIQNKKVKMAHHSDNTNSYKKTKEEYEATFMHKIDWAAVTQAEAGEELKLYTPDYIYTFHSR